MKEIFQEYGGILITVVAIVALIAVIKFVVGDSEVVKNAFTNLVNGFVNQAGVISTQSTTK